MDDSFKLTLNNEMKTYDLSLEPEVVDNLTYYFDLLTRWNSRLHLVAPCSPQEFATRHVLESLVLLKYLPVGATVVDVGSGGGLPLIPCLIAREDLNGTLIESSRKKGVFLNEALNRLGLSGRAKVLVQRFEETEAPNADFVTCRALEQLVEKVPGLVKWAPPGSTLLLFGGEALSNQFERVLLPNSERRFLYIHRRDAEI
jgi:16S rRNA (guanine527-N7)-methyltransferase